MRNAWGGVEGGGSGGGSKADWATVVSSGRLGISKQWDAPFIQSARPWGGLSAVVRRKDQVRRLSEVYGSTLFAWTINRLSAEPGSAAATVPPGGSPRSPWRDRWK